MFDMDSLRQRLRELTKDQFESLVHQFLVGRYPGAGIKKVDGTGGDRGIDSFSGTLSDGPAVWQSKHFPNRIGRSQKKQILQSIQTVMEAYRPKRWTLCVPIDLRTEEHKWFQSEVVARYKDCCAIELIQASEILAELSHDRPLRDTFFPDSSITNALRIREIATGTEKASLEQKGLLTVEVAQQFLEGNMDLEPRLQPILSIALSRSPLTCRTLPGSVFSVSRGEAVIDYVPRDPSTYNLDPVGLQITLNRAHSDRMEKAINTGKPFRFPAGAILKFDSESPLLRHLFGAHDPIRLQFQRTIQ